MKRQIPLEVSFHRKASASCEIGFSHGGPQRGQISGGRIKTSTQLLSLTRSYTAVFTVMSSTCPFPQCVYVCAWMVHMCALFICASESVATRTACFLFRGRKRTEGTPSAKHADSEFINLHFCTSKCNWTRLQKCTRLLI